ncbi:uncharacterized protein BP01DRAFT_309090 [Aspergillus saccharolyticus JOP 1030-1]|uniref:Secreted protein n=1 Tax=Aspergillus saccharolyticus JOP 1030-1 TaxID=1450539 RepID=A0A318Z8V2_9EURO|nr:hypothetical protein BP01DRAFT_309090 [Aspergillus saccharolyticus JOP 1030-1]PYH40070.1 hypothetical protein BP01DRAFT_309090 [Aspergillus saccharolyticus JOP 1030-1]
MFAARGLATLVMLATTALGIPCYKHARDPTGKNCVDLNKFGQFASDWCADNFNTSSGDWQMYPDGEGNTGSIGKLGQFNDSASCKAAAQESIDTCKAGGWDGAVWSADGVNLNLNFCAWVDPSA